jgi:hypothetical protein
MHAFDRAEANLCVTEGFPNSAYGAPKTSELTKSFYRYRNVHHLQSKQESHHSLDIHLIFAHDGCRPAQP